MNDIIFQPLPGEFALITGGGTRTAIKLSRPWQPSLPPIAPEKCPFCKESQLEEISLPNLPAGWCLRSALYTPHRRHRLVIPKKCWDAETLQKLGGYARISEALEIVRLATKDDQVEMSTFIHVGYSAGQNLAHAHWHLMEVRVREPLMLAGFSQELLVLQGEKFNIFAQGARAGECLVVSREKQLKFNEDMAKKLADVLEWIVARGNEKFRSTEGRPPEFSISVRISADGYFRYADYCPILNAWGATEYVFAHLEGSPITLPWPHELTAAYLRE
ncbi:hypothetical protein A3I27_02530 [Candidatus Giovannonibacteria bacterium RIFCSPLOWO2_02_FULL_43_11b]|uniref:Galactose-1-phosphate uridyl transferase N-terminal domain-containing protein n=1 Tax=Candidatus Giovannonibacteria bacterium RIFCSPHIGHO2_12_FULL_43_15 TaxID=1798341 RepID=A0A1F5WP09_9BACT|nr:MAG: hypothetical protein A2739_03445 [Candidatus Giovannonibacteria bacterium RIFCSPHIGHO2_01_FULL_43_100]OGF66316.1 MAG: hypothetical protein A3B97_01940 [Candidatus Giovannonibacteria bacterium RIFCSPHIGHO2_02_FULL_43_32]OGF77386.1 MAG: hypothetical protein A3F23_00360 [Candidatus Giovannonibacteria bacterium RIFCSPHIGHO2_12_FULL_43_15]OGF79209.1 MAG: hypothetical protein A3A15_01125 [Candidatus Giovannonibacteria bacterium RIFCSPLOWO2_01_FULL_43_60]OGF90518.1 MAG: hypothetical protein A3